MPGHDADACMLIWNCCAISAATAAYSQALGRAWLAVSGKVVTVVTVPYQHAGISMTVPYQHASDGILSKQSITTNLSIIFVILWPT
jgi:hypothetical protein